MVCEELMGLEIAVSSIKSREKENNEAEGREGMMLGKKNWILKKQHQKTFCSTNF